MSVKRTRHPFGLLPDHIEIVLDEETSVEDLTALAELVNRSTIVSRIQRLRRHAQMVPLAAELYSLALQKGAGSRDIEDDFELRARVAEAEGAAMYFDAEELPEKALRRSQQANAQRSRSKNACRLFVIKAMRVARKSGQQLSDFLDMALAGSIRGLAMSKVSHAGVDHYDIEVDDGEVTADRTVSVRTFSDWWSESGRSD